MPNCSRLDVVLVTYPFSDLSGAKVRPAIVVNAPFRSQDLLIVPLTSKVLRLLPGEFVLDDWLSEGLNIETAVKRGIYTIKDTLVLKRLGQLSTDDASHLQKSLLAWLGLRFSN